MIAHHLLDTLRHRFQRFAGNRVRIEDAVSPQTEILAEPFDTEQAILMLGLSLLANLPQDTSLLLRASECQDPLSVAVEFLIPGNSALVEPAIAASSDSAGWRRAVHFLTQGGGEVLSDAVNDQVTGLRVNLPIRRPPSTTPDPGGALPQGGETVLLVEDESFVRSAVRELLSLCGYCVLEASGGHDALRVARDHQGPIHLLLTDVVMPGVNGCDLAMALAQLRPGLRILFMSGYADAEIGWPRVLAQGRECLRKPFSLDALARKVREVLEPTAEHAVTRILLSVSCTT